MHQKNGRAKNHFFQLFFQNGAPLVWPKSVWSISAEKDQAEIFKTLGTEWYKSRPALSRFRTLGAVWPKI